MNVSPTADGSGVLLQVLVVPGATRSAVVGDHDGALRVRVSAPPERGRANAAVCALLAGALGLARRDVDVVRGGSSRRKTVRIAGLSPAEVTRRLGPTR